MSTKYSREYLDNYEKKNSLIELVKSKNEKTFKDFVNNCFNTTIDKEKRKNLILNIRKQINLIKEKYDESRKLELKEIKKVVIDGFEFEEPVFEKHDKPIKEFGKDELKDIKQLNLILKMCDLVEKDNNINEEIQFEKEPEKFFNEIERILTNPTKNEKEDMEYKGKETIHDIKEDKEVDFPILKRNLKELPDYIFQRIRLIDYFYKQPNRSDDFKFWSFNIVQNLTDKTLIKTYFNINYEIFDENFNMEDLSLLITMTKIGFDYSQFKNENDIEYEIV